MKLVIAEKRSVAKTIAAAIGASEDKKGYIQGNGYLVTWCVGHLIQQATPEQYSPDLKKWSMDTLPIIPNEWKTTVIESSQSQYEIIKSLMEQPQVTELVCATDAEREGELIFRHVYNHAECKKPFKRLWLSSFVESSIVKAFENLKDGSEYDSLYESALARQQADWLVGINATRLYSSKYNTLLNVGRVQSAAVKMIVDRQKEIEDFVPSTYYPITANLGSFIAATKVNDLRSTEDIISKIRGQEAYVIKVEKKTVTDKPPLLYNLSTLQAEANKMLGYTAQQTLDVAQSLYEGKLLTYPRTSSQYLAEDMRHETNKILLDLSKNLSVPADQNKYSIDQVINQEKLSDHHAIVPTTLAVDLTKLSEAEKNIFLLVAYKLLMATYESAQFETTKVNLDVNEIPLTANGKVIINDGYHVIKNHLTSVLKSKAEEEQKDTILPPMSEGNTYVVIDVKYTTSQTKPPQPYTDGTLIHAMKNVGNTIGDAELKKTLKATDGLGTEATRANILEKIIKTGFVERKGKQLLSTELASNLMSILPANLKNAEMTADWENQLEQIKVGKLKSTDFLDGIKHYISEIVSGEKMFYDREEIKATNPFKKDLPSIGKCPICGGDVIERKLSYSCANNDFALWKEDNFFKNKGKQLSIKDVQTLLDGKALKLKGCTSTKSDKKYDVNVTLKITDGKPQYESSFPESKKAKSNSR